MNHPMQGTAADIMKLAMIEVDRRLRAEGFRARMVLQVHDELVFEAPADEVERSRHGAPRRCRAWRSCGAARRERRERGELGGREVGARVQRRPRRRGDTLRGMAALSGSTSRR